MQPANEQRQTPRTPLKQVVRIRPFDPDLPPEYCTTFNVSQGGLYFATSANHYIPGMNVYITSDFQLDSPLDRTLSGAIVRIDHLESDLFGVAVQIFLGR